MDNLKVAVIGGGSSYTPELIEGFIKRSKELPVREIYLVDTQEGKDKLEIIYGLTKRMINKAKLNVKVYKTLNRKEAIKDADFVITQLRVGGLKARASDERIPLTHNAIGQETTGAGGFAKAIRTIPVILDICRDIEKLSPKAWLINFTNPAGIITEMVLRHTNVKTLGLCNVPINMVNNVANILDVDSKRVKIDFAGLNHMVYGTEIYLDGKNVTPIVLEKLGNGELINMKNIPDLKWDKDFIKALKMLPCPYHRYYYMTDEILNEEITALKENKGTRAKQVMEIEKELFKKYADTTLDQKPKVLEKRGGAYYSDAAVSLISALYNDKGEIHTVNIRNNGAIASLPDDVVVEVNAVIGKSGAKPIAIGELPVKINGLVQQVKSYEVLTVKAGLTGDYYTALMALGTNPLVPSVGIAKKILDDILSENRNHLPQFNIENKER